MTKINVAEVKAKLSEYLDRVLAGEQVVICRHNTPVAELRAITGGRLEPRPIGRLPGRPTFEVPASFFEALPDEELDRWEGATSRAYPEAERHGAAASRLAEGKTPFGGRAKPTRSRRKS